MKRFLAAALITGLFSTCTLVGCTEETKEKKVETISTPDGDKKVTSEVKVEATGDQKSTAAPAPATTEAPK